MVSVTVYRQPGGLARGIRVEGHAGAGPYGEDIVCAAASALVQTAAAALEEIAGLAGAAAKGEGLYEIRVPQGRLREGEAASVILETACIGYRLIAGSYPKHLRVTERER
jgi:uncharacterized protein YsxB (DUF464 family)